MASIHSIAAKLSPVDTRSTHDIEAEIRDELAFHLAMRAEENARRGMTPAEAEAAAMERFGNVGQIFDACRQAQLGERIMLQRIQTTLIAVLLVAVLAVGFQSYTAQRANQTALADVAVQLERLGRSAPAATARDDRGAPPNWEAERPRVVATFPADGETLVDPATAEIRVSFDKPMSDGSWSWVRSSAEAFPESVGDVRYEEDMQTCVMPVKLEPGTKYVVWFNTSNYQNFKDREGRPAVPSMLRFQTAPDSTPSAHIAPDGESQ